jgi:hypothetical protein
MKDVVQRFLSGHILRMFSFFERFRHGNPRKSVHSD